MREDVVEVELPEEASDNCRDCDGTGWFYQMEGCQCHCQLDKIE